MKTKMALKKVLCVILAVATAVVGIPFSALAATKDLELITGTFTLDDKHNPVKSATILEFVNGEQQFKTKIDPQ